MAPLVAEPPVNCDMPTIKETQVVLELGTGEEAPEVCGIHLGTKAAKLPLSRCIISFGTLIVPIFSIDDSPDEGLDPMTRLASMQS